MGSDASQSLFMLNSFYLLSKLCFSDAFIILQHIQGAAQVCPLCICTMPNVSCLPQTVCFFPCETELAVFISPWCTVAVSQWHVPSCLSASWSPVSAGAFCSIALCHIRFVFFLSCLHACLHINKAHVLVQFQRQFFFGNAANVKDESKQHLWLCLCCKNNELVQLKSARGENKVTRC